MASSSPEETAARPLREDGGILFEHESIYSPGRRLLLRSHKPLPPYGSHLYPLPDGWTSRDMMISDEEKAFSLRRLVFHPNNAPKTIDKNNQDDHAASMEVEIIRMIGGSPGEGYRPGPQKLLCKVVASPSPAAPNEREHEIPFEGQLLFLKVFDPLFWHTIIGIPKRLTKVTVQADSAFSDEFGAYNRLFEKELTGFPHVAPQFYGGWTTAVKSICSSFTDCTRDVAVLATEFIDGTSFHHLFSLDGPISEVVELHNSAGSRGSFAADQDGRMKIIEQLLGGTVSQEYTGVDHCEVYPENVIIIMRNKGESLDEPRAVLVGYGRALVDDLRTRPAKMWEYYPLEPHPILRCGWPRWKFFAGWIPAAWASPPGKEDHVPLFNQWVVLTFGRLDVNEKYAAFPTVPQSSLLEGREN
ncbi:hypothetical protein HER10_EVM0011550 [Colletotrichum scovillei]|uniref:Uncharacterized protein n=1 Tax=Colletotrichum scovillei TaxID=1209932 RepID=A0A9P7QV17_9PEZI|nr:uncharacterized protein HER10_EVM0011550 [Colletotrichum scovillei]KAF4778854.1 hypothetical protein HER10_EVM0011550 [Colletotrichum scovillei]KAG7043667.1 hypothetical protein JMJ77_0011489 [Colletotrichum scovillei]KAG7045771.1 hypothetical protein JMJ78_0010842 [Colletotrichum scovillei]KAG7063116.1 hypothetical protein JMJ76_0005584 [Colletotrichum scovillei]